MSRGMEIATWGTVIRDAERKTSAAGNSYTTLVLSAPSGQTDDKGQDVPAFLRCIAFKDLADVAASLKKGARAYIEGALSVGIWQPPDGSQSRLDLSVRLSRLEPTRIGKNRPPRAEASPPAARADPQAPLRMAEPGSAEPFDPETGDALPY